MSYATSDAVHPPRSRAANLSQKDVSPPDKFLKSATVGVIGCPFSGGQPKAGVDTGPHHLIDFGLLEQIKELGYNVSFGGHQQFAEVMTNTTTSDPDIGKLKRPRYVGRVTRAVKEAVEERCRRGELALTLGGDHSLAIGTVSGVFSAYPDACLIWIDAVRVLLSLTDEKHADINTPESTTSGNIHGMPVSFLMGLAGELPESLAWVSS
jgi:arginase